MTTKILGVTAAAAALGAAGLALARRQSEVAKVAPELRHPMLYVPLAAANKATMLIGRRLFARSTQLRPGVTVTPRSIPGLGGEPDVAVYVYDFPGRERPGGALLWIHGGGRIMGLPAGDHDLLSWIALQAGVTVVSVQYRLAPEHPFPAALDDCAAALAWMHEQADALGIDPARVAVGGASAGGGLAAELAQRAHDDDIPVAFQLLEYPMLDDRTLHVDSAGRGRLSWLPRSNRYSWGAYLGHRAGEPETRPYAVAARREDLSGLPPAWIGVGDLDLFYEEDVAYARRLRAAGVPCELHTEPAMYHGADLFVRPMPAAAQAFRSRMVGAVAAAIGTTAPGCVGRGESAPGETS